MIYVASAIPLALLVRCLPSKALGVLLTEFSQLTPLFFRLVGMATPPSKHFGLPIDMEMSIVDIIDVEEDAAYHRCITTIWVEKGLDNLVPHRYIARYVWFDRDIVDPH